MQTESFQQIFNKEREKIYRFALRILEDPLIAEDVRQEVLVKCWKHEKELQVMDNPAAWMMRVTRNLCIDKLRKIKRKAHVDLEEAHGLAGEEPHPGRSTEISDLMTTLKTILETFPEKQKMVFHLREIEGMAYKEIGEILEMNLDDVKVNLHRARKKMQYQLSKVDSYGLS